MMWFISDTHFGHQNIIRFCNRPFVNIKDMDDCLIENWNKLIKPEDVIYHLGDFGFGSKNYINTILSALKGQKILIIGSHDNRILKYHANQFTEANRS